MVQLANIRQHIAPFKPLPWQFEPWKDKSPVLLLTGSAGGGKSRLAAEKLHAFCQKYPGATCVAVRKNRAIMTNSTIAFLEKTVIGRDPNVRHVSSLFRFEYKNGSILAYAGMDDDQQREHFKSIGQDGGADLLWFEEANAFCLNDFDVGQSRLRGKAGSFRQFILTTNPDSPLHWIYERLILKKQAKVYYSKAADNSYNPEDYQDKLNSLSGVNKLRLADGIWSQAEGLVYEEWRDDLDSVDSNVTELAEYNPYLPVYWAVDNGYSGEEDESGNFTENSHPLVILFYHIDTKGDMLIFDELYRIKRQPEEVIREALETKPYPKPTQAIVDRSAAALKNRLYDDFCIDYVNSKGLVEEGIKETRSWIKPDQNGHRRLKVNPRCNYLRKEFVSYINGKDGKPKKAFDHGCDVVRYACVEHSIQ